MKQRTSRTFDRSSCQQLTLEMSVTDIWSACIHLPSSSSVQLSVYINKEMNPTECIVLIRGLAIHLY